VVDEGVVGDAEGAEEGGVDLVEELYLPWV